MLVLALVSVAVAMTGHALGHGMLLDPASLLVAVVLAVGVGAVVDRRWSVPRLIAGLAVVQVVVHVLGGHAADARLVSAALPHGHAALDAGPGGTSPSMLAWHVVAVPVSALLLVAVERSLALLASLARRLRVVRPAVLPARRPAAMRLHRPRLLSDLPHLTVSRSNAPPCPA